MASAHAMQSSDVNSIVRQKVDNVDSSFFEHKQKYITILVFSHIL